MAVGLGVATLLASYPFAKSAFTGITADRLPSHSGEDDMALGILALGFLLLAAIAAGLAFWARSPAGGVPTAAGVLVVLFWFLASTLHAKPSTEPYAPPSPGWLCGSSGAAEEGFAYELEGTERDGEIQLRGRVRAETSEWQVEPTACQRRRDSAEVSCRLQPSGPTLVVRWFRVVRGAEVEAYRLADGWQAELRIEEDDQTPRSGSAYVSESCSATDVAAAEAEVTRHGRRPLFRTWYQGD